MCKKLTYDVIHFDELTTEELYDVMVLRQEVFVVEQDCAYLDADGKDMKSLHLLGRMKGELLAYARLVPPGISYQSCSSIGRVITSAKLRGKGYGRPLMQHAIEHTISLWKDHDIKISAQSHLVDFYGDIGFRSTGKEYLEDGMPHTEMIFNIKM